MKAEIVGILAGLAIVCSANAQENVSKEISFNEGTNFGISVAPQGGIVAMDLQGVLWTLPTSGGTAKALTTGQQPEAREPAFSPDGKKIAFQGFYQGYFHIWTIDVDGSNLTQITHGSYDDREPTWGGDNETILFASDREGSYDIWEINIENNRVRQITDHPDDEGQPHVNRDGQRLLYTREIKDDYSEIVLDELENGENSEIVVMHSKEIKFYRPSWSRKRNGFSYISHINNDTKLNYVHDVNDLKVINDAEVVDDGDIFPFRPHWTDNGVYYTADGQIKYRSVRARVRSNDVLVSVGETRPISFEATITANPPSYAKKKRDFDSTESQMVRGIGSMDVSAEDDKIVFTALGDMWMQDGNGVPRNLDDGPGQINDPAWSRDGRRIAYVAERDGQMDVYIRDMVSGQDLRLTNDLNREYRVSFSRSGRYIAFLSTRGVSNTWGRADLKVLDTQYGSIQLIDESIHTPGRPVWTADEEHIIIAVADPATSRFREGTHVIRQYHVESRRSKNLDMPGGIGLSTRDGSGPVISRDESKIAYISEGEIRVAYISPSGEINTLSQNRCGEVAHMPRWGWDSETVYYMAGRNLRSCNFLTGEIKAQNFNMSWVRAKAGDKTIHVERLFDGVSDRYQENVDVFISGGRITKIAPHGSEPVIGEFIDYSRDTMIPGIMAGHTHQTELYGEKLGRNWLAYGVTSVRDPGTNPYKSLMRKETWESGKQMGPRMFYAGWLTGGARVYYGQSYNAINERALRHEIFRAQDLDYDMMKSYVRLPDEFQQIVVEEAHKMGIPVSSHEISPAVQNGMDSLEHIAATSRRGYSPKFTSHGKSYSDVINIISQSGLFITPTATLDSGYYNYVQKHPEYISEPKYMAFLDQYQRNGLLENLDKQWVSNEIRKNPAVLKSLKGIQDAGANMAAGTDSPFLPYGIAQHMEIIQFVDAGLSPAEALRAASIKVAQNIGVEDDLGTIEVGKLADMVIVDGDPLENIADIRNVEATIKGGHHYTIRELITNRGQ